MGIASIVLLAAFLVVLGVFLAWPATLSAGFVGVSSIVVGGVILFENVLWPRLGERRTVRR